MDTAYWAPLLDMFRKMETEGTTSPHDMDLMLVTDSVDDAMAHLERNAVERFRLTRLGPTPSVLLGEGGRSPTPVVPTTRLPR